MELQNVYTVCDFTYTIDINTSTTTTTHNFNILLRGIY